MVLLTLTGWHLFIFVYRQCSSGLSKGHHEKIKTIQHMNIAWEATQKQIRSPWSDSTQTYRSHRSFVNVRMAFLWIIATCCQLCRSNETPSGYAYARHCLFCRLRASSAYQQLMLTKKSGFMLTPGALTLMMCVLCSQLRHQQQSLCYSLVAMMPSCSPSVCHTSRRYVLPGHLQLCKIPCVLLSARCVQTIRF